jgi:hypothetical protein
MEAAVDGENAVARTTGRKTGPPGDRGQCFIRYSHK